MLIESEDSEDEEEVPGFGVVEDLAAQIEQFERIERRNLLRSLGVDPDSQSDVEEKAHDVNLFN